MQSTFSELKIRALVPYRGACFGLSGKAALLTLDFTPPEQAGTFDWARADQRLSDVTMSLRPSDADDSDWRSAASRINSPGGTKTDPFSAEFGDRLAGLVILIQQWLRFPVAEAAVTKAGPGQLVLAFEWWTDSSLLGVVRQAATLLLQAVDERGSEAFTQSRDVLRDWMEKHRKQTLSPSNFRFAMAAKKQGVPHSWRQNFLQLGWGRAARRLDGSFTQSTPSISVRMARLKIQASQLLGNAGLPVPAGELCGNVDQGLSVAAKLGWPVVVKPSNMDQGVAVVPDIRAPEMFRRAFAGADKHSPGAVIVEKHIAGEDHRMLVVGGQLLAVTRRTPGGVTGDGVHSVRALLDRLNADPRRGTDKRSMLIRIDLDEEALGCLAERNLGLDDIPHAGDFVRLRRTSNISCGGTADDLTNSVHPDNRALAIRAARLIDLDIAGVDFLCPDIGRSWREIGGAICEVNAQPGFRVHWLGDPSRDINGEVLSWLVDGGSARIPVTAIAGNGDAGRISSMLKHVWQHQGDSVGLCTPGGVWVGDELVSTDRIYGLPAVRLVLNDSAVDSAIIELPDEEVGQFGHPCDAYDLVALFGPLAGPDAADDGTAADLAANIRQEVFARARKAVIVGAEDVSGHEGLGQSACPRRIIIGAPNPEAVIAAHLGQGGEAVFVEPHDGEPWIVLAKADERIALMPLQQLPAAQNGSTSPEVRHALFVAALAWARDLPLTNIREALATFPIE